jgi:hypothetical protein
VSWTESKNKPRLRRAQRAFCSPHFPMLRARSISSGVIDWLTAGITDVVG